LGIPAHDRLRRGNQPERGVRVPAPGTRTGTNYIERGERRIPAHARPARLTLASAQAAGLERPAPAPIVREGRLIPSKMVLRRSLGPEVRVVTACCPILPGSLHRRSLS
jgi:hypothetical protein